MPIHKNPDGTWQWGKSGKKYKNKEDAIKQMKAIFANGYVEKKASSDFVYTYLPRLNTALTLGILGTLRSPNGWLKYKKRSGLNTKLEVIKYLNSLLPNRSKAFSAFSLPISLDALLDYKLFARQKLLYKVKLALLIRDARILSIYKTGLGKLTTKVYQVTNLPIDWKTPRGLYLFSRIPHYIVAVKDGAVPPLYILKKAAKSIDFPLELVLDLKKRLDSYQPIYTTRVDKLFDKYKKGDLLDNTLINLPLYVALSLIILDLKAHRFLEHLTLDQKQLLKKYTKMKVLRLMPYSWDGNPVVGASAGTGIPLLRVRISDLIRAIKDNKIQAKNIDILDIPAIHTKVNDAWGDGIYSKAKPLTIKLFANTHLPRIEKADMQYPIIIRLDHGQVLDGMHRLLKAIYNKQQKIKAYEVPVDMINRLAYKLGQTKKAALTLLLLKLRVAPYYTEDRKKHIQDVLKYALKLKGSKLSPLLLAIIYYHDILRKRVGGIGHLLAGAKFALKDLKKLYTKDQVKRVAQAIRLHSPDYRMSIKNFRHSSPLALLLALADDMNVRHRDPDNMAKISVKFIKKHPLLFPTNPLFAYNRHISYFGPHHAHKNLKYYKKLWNRLMARPMKLIDNYPKLRFMKLWHKIKADSLIPDIDSIYYNPDNITYG